MANSIVNPAQSSLSATSNPLSTSYSTLTSNPLNPSATAGSTLTTSASSSTSLGGGTGLRGEYYAGRNFNTLKQSRTDASVNFNWGAGAPTSAIAADNFSVRWTGQIQPKFSETYTFYTNSDDGVRLWVNGKALINDWTTYAVKENKGSINLTAGQKYDIKLEYFEAGANAVSSLKWSSKSQAKEVIPKSQLFTGATATKAAASQPPTLDGNTIATAQPIANASNTTLNDAVGSSDPVDYYRFDLATPSTFKVALSGLSAGAKVDVLDGAGNVIRAGGSANNSNGLKGEYFDNADFTNLKLTRKDATVNFDWMGASPDTSIASDTFSARWTGQIQPKYSETYTFYTSSDDGSRLWINGQQVINRWQGGSAETQGKITLQAGQKYDIKLEYYEDGFGARSQLSWSSASQTKQIIPQSQLFSLSDQLVDDALYAGSYYIRVASPTGANTNYRLALTSQSARETAKSAYSFTDSVGVNTHLRYYDTAYGNYPMIKQRLQELGVRHIRESGSDPTWIQRVNDLGKAGIKSTIVVDPNIGISPNSTYAMRSVNYNINDLVKNKLPGSVAAVEVLNEFDYFSNQFQYTYQGKPVTSSNWVTYVRDSVRDTYNAINSDPATQNIPVIGPSFVNTDSSTKIGDLSQWVDFGNAHPYNYPNNPGNGNLERDIATRSKPFANRPMVATEAGWHTGSAKSDRPVSEIVQSKYLARMYLEHFDQGVQRTYGYELIDQKVNPDDKEMNFGLLRQDGSAKPAFTAQKNLMSLLSDASTKFPTGSLDYYLKGNTQNVRHTLLQKSNGEFFLALWLEVPSTNQDQTQRVTVNLMSPVSQATTYLPNRSTAATGQYTKPTQLTLDVPDHPMLVKLTP